MFKKLSNDIALRSPSVIHGETSRYNLVGQDTGDICGYMTRQVSKVEHDGKLCYELATTTNFADSRASSEIVILEITDFLRPLSYSRVMRNGGGQVIMEAKMWYVEEYEEINIIPQAGMSFCMRGGPFLPKSKITMCMIMPEARQMKIHGNVIRDTVKVPVGTFQCYKIDIVPDTQSMMDMMPSGARKIPGMGSVLQNFVPSMCRWFTQEEPHYLLKAEGAAMGMGPPASEAVNEELVGIEIDGRSVL